MPEYLPLKALKAFEVTARMGSFKRAAEELHVTTGAVSQQIKTLEDILGVKLFHRLHHGLELTDAAKQGIPKLASGFSNLQVAMQKMQEGGGHESLKVWSAPSFASQCLLGPLASFTQAHPHIETALFASDIMIGTGEAAEMFPAKSFYKKDIDIGIFYGRGEFAEYRADKLLSVDLVPMCSPTLVNDKTHPLKSPEDLIHHALIHDDTAFEGRPDWSGWLRQLNLGDIDTRRGLHVNQMALAIDAAVAGQGVVLGVKQLAEKELRSGQLVIPFGPSEPLEHAYYVVSLQDTQDEPKIRQFREWILNTFALEKEP